MFAERLVRLRVHVRMVRSLIWLLVCYVTLWCLIDASLWLSSGIIVMFAKKPVSPALR